MSSSFLWGEVGVIEDCYKRVMLPFESRERYVERIACQY
jgi:hypothetical protein